MGLGFWPWKFQQVYHNIVESISGSNVRVIFRAKDVVLLPTSIESDALRGERKSLLNSHRLITNELESDNSLISFMKKLTDV